MNSRYESLQIPEEARIWTYGLPQQLSGTERKVLEEEIGAFVSGWAAHGQRLDAGFHILEDRFLILWVDERQQAATGCSIDDSVSFIRRLGKQLGTDLCDRNRVFFEVYLDRSKNETCKAYSQRHEGEGNFPTPPLSIFQQIAGNNGNFVLNAR